eukprot:GHRR01031621.1.p1 GENE.GHRR01031621.1~~GHRR01031621.1.p1  ORF type:complete len:104 (+),score=8.08 GHRR01031621.1:281-592(+)
MLPWCLVLLLQHRVRCLCCCLPPHPVYSTVSGLYNTALVVRLVLTWFPNPPSFIIGPLSTLCDPYLNLFRGIIPPLGGTLDFSPILAFVLLSVSAAQRKCKGS